MIGLYLAIIMVWVWFCLVTCTRPMRVILLAPVLLPWFAFVIIGILFFESLRKLTRTGMEALHARFDSSHQKGGA